MRIVMTVIACAASISCGNALAGNVARFYHPNPNSPVAPPLPSTGEPVVAAYGTTTDIELVRHGDHLQKQVTLAKDGSW
jgi:hypothetical protein